MSLNDRHTSNKLKRLLRTRQRRFRHSVYAVLRDLFERLEEAEVTELTIGDLTGIRDDDSKTSRSTNQKLHSFWSFDVMQRRIMALGEEYRIKITTVDEGYTSRLCSLCGKRHRNGRRKRGLYYCSTYRRCINADVNGAMNILRKVAAIPAKVSGSGLVDGAALAFEVGCICVGG